MSFEGYYRKLCKNGHLWTEDCNGVDFVYCPYCGSEEVWHELIDQTNGFGEDQETKLKEVGFDKEPKVDDFGNFYYIKRIKYEIPKKNITKDPEEVVGYKVIKPFNNYDVGHIFYFGIPDGITSYVEALDKDSGSIPSWLCESIPEYFQEVKRKEVLS